MNVPRRAVASSRLHLAVLLAVGGVVTLSCLGILFLDVAVTRVHELRVTDSALLLCGHCVLGSSASLVLANELHEVYYDPGTRAVYVSNLPLSALFKLVFD